MSSFLKPDLVLDGYQLVRFLGRGGFGEVWLCRSQAMGDYRALKWIPVGHTDRLEKEYESLLHYRKAAAGIRSPHLVSIEHVNRNENGLYYIMPLADGISDYDPSHSDWQPKSLTSLIVAQSSMDHWFTSSEIINLIRPVLDALQTLSAAGLVHRDVKPENILFFNGHPCLGDISLMGEDASVITRRGTPGYATPSWYEGGHPDMFGAAATLYTLLTGNAPDKMGRSAFLWPPQGRESLSDREQAEWQRLHQVIRRATEERIPERFISFDDMTRAIHHESTPITKSKRKLLIAIAICGLVASAVAFAIYATNKDDQAENGIETAETEQPTQNSEPELTEAQLVDYRILVGMIQGYIASRDYTNALATIEEFLSTYPQARSQSAYSIFRAMALIGLDRIDEAREELKKDIHISPLISPMANRKEIWESLGDLEEAENDLTRILDAYGHATFPLFLRADVRAQRGDYPGVHADRQAALEVAPDEPDQHRLVDTMWSPLETKYPGYGEFVKSIEEK